MQELDTSGWKQVGRTSNSDCFEVEPGILAAVPHLRTVDTLLTARENQAFQNEYFRRTGGGVVLVFFDRIAFQEKEARAVYSDELDAEAIRGSALIGGTAIARTLASFFLGIFKPKVPLKMFGDLPTALDWARSLNGEAKRPAVG